MEIITAGRPAVYELTEKKSKFIAYIFPIGDAEAAADRIAQVRKEHKSATHVVYAFCAGANAQRSTDDGEPSGTAGRPVLEVIKAAALDYVIILVVRYFGGTLLGTGGLVRAYTQAAQGAVQAAGRAAMLPAHKLLLSIPYTALSDFQHRLESFDHSIESCEYKEKALMTLLIAAEQRQPLEEAMRQYEIGGYLLDEHAVMRKFL